VTDIKEHIYGAEWHAYSDPEVPEYFNPTTVVLDGIIAGGRADHTALIVDTDRYSYTDVLRHVCRAANGLQGLGIEYQSRMLMFGTDSVEFIATWLGAIRAGIIPVVVSDAYKAPNLLYFLNDTACRTLYIDEEQLEKLHDIAEDIPWTLKNVIVRGDASGAPESGDRNTLSFDEMVEGCADVFDPVPLHRNDVTYMFYSGGTTGPAKGITHLAHDFHICPSRHGPFLEYTRDDIVHATSKKYFTHGIWPGVLIPFFYGATSVISRLPPTPENLVGVIEATKPTKLITVPTIIKNLLVYAEQAKKKPDLSSLSVVTSASEKMPPEVFERFHALFGLEILDSIGSSEITYEWIANRPKEFRRGSLGKPVFGFQAKLVDQDGNEVTEPGVDGEVWIKSVTTCFFYWRKLEKTQQTFIGDWMRTGDTLQLDEDGFFWFSGRYDDVFKVKGLWVSPIEVEAAITEHDSVLEAAVIAYDDTDGLTKPKAFVVLRPGDEATQALEDELRANVRKIGGYKVPEEWEFVEALPRTTLMKIDRRTLREMEREKRGQG
jgi:benzoate-CoA ligase family protein